MLGFAQETSIRGELYLGFAEHDPAVPATAVATLRRALKANRGVDYTMDTFPDTRHGFCFSERCVYHETSAEIAWSRLVDLFSRRLQG